MKVALLGSKGVGMRVMQELPQYADLGAVVTVADQGDARSCLDHFVARGATVVSSRAEADRVLHNVEAELIIVAGWYWMVPANELRRRPFVGVHHSLLPSYRGGSPLVWALIEGQSVVGTTWFTLTEEMDAGPIWAQASLPVLDGYIADVQARCDDAAIALLPRLFQRETHPQPQDPSGAFSRPSRRSSDGLIDWSRPAMDVVRWIRAQSRPYPGAFTFRGRELLRIWRASNAGSRIGAPGDVLEGAVVCGDGHGVLVEEASTPIANNEHLRASDGPGAHVSGKNRE